MENIENNESAKKNLLSYLKGDRAIWFAVSFLMLFGSIIIYSSTSTLAYKYQDGNTFYYILRHMFCIVIGLILMVFFSRFSYKSLFKVSAPALWVSVGLLVFTFFLGNNTNDARRWFTIPFLHISFQTSDLAKVTLMLYLANVLSTCQDTLEAKKAAFKKCLIAVGVVCLLVLPSNLSTALLIGFTSVVVMLVGQIPWKWIGVMVLSLMVAGVLVIGFLKVAGIHTRLDTWVSRITTYTSSEVDKSDSDYQAEQAKIAIARGGFIGQGPGKSVQRNVVPHPYSDYVFAILCEECGLWGPFLVIMAYIIFFYRCISVVKGVERTFPAFVVVGLSLNIVLQALAHLLVVTNIFPVTGQPLPFVSMGGTSIFFTSLSVGVILNISRYSGKTETVSEIEEGREAPEEIQDFPFMAG